jgi:hypothetical protein
VKETFKNLFNDYFDNFNKITEKTIENYIKLIINELDDYFNCLLEIDDKSKYEKMLSKIKKKKDLFNLKKFGSMDDNFTSNNQSTTTLKKPLKKKKIQVITLFEILNEYEDNNYLFLQYKKKFHKELITVFHQKYIDTLLNKQNIIRTKMSLKDMEDDYEEILNYFSNYKIEITELKEILNPLYNIRNLLKFFSKTDNFVMDKKFEESFTLEISNFFKNYEGKINQ